MTRYGGDLRRRQVLAGSLLLPPLALTLSGFTSIEALFAPKAELWPYWQDHNPNDQRRIDHGAWRKLLAGHILTDGQGLNRFNYSAVTAENRRSLNAYINALADLPITDLNRDEQLAYWINLYNALTVKLILQHYPVATIRDIDISPGLFSDGPWDKPLVTIEGHPVSLNDIEHRILRPIWQDPRIHYAVNCASVGCPNLQAEAFTGENLDSLLDAAARGFVNSPRGVRLEDGRLIVSSIYIWFGSDFGENDAAVIAHLVRFADADLARALEGVEAISDHGYDWTLNDGKSS